MKVESDTVTYVCVYVLVCVRIYVCMYICIYEALPRTPHGLAFRYDHLHTYIHIHTYVNAYTYIHHVILTEVVLDAFDGLSGQVGK
jgi:hypothetical protein